MSALYAKYGRVGAIFSKKINIILIFIAAVIYLSSLLLTLTFKIESYLPQGVEIESYEQELKLFPLPYMVINDLSLVSASGEKIANFSRLESLNILKKIIFWQNDALEIFNSEVTIYFKPFKDLLISSNEVTFNINFQNTNFNIYNEGTSFIRMKTPKFRIEHKNKNTILKGVIKAVNNKYDINANYDGNHAKLTSSIKTSNNEVLIDGIIKEPENYITGNITFKLPDDEAIFKEIFGIDIVKSSLLDKGSAEFFINQQELEINNIIFEGNEVEDANYIRINHNNFDQIQIALNINEISTPAVDEILQRFKNIEDVGNYIFTQATSLLESTDLSNLNIANITCNINIKNFNIGKKNLNNVNISFENLFNSILLNNFSFNIEEKNQFKLNGIISNNDARSEFQGKVLIKIPSVKSLYPEITKYLPDEVNNDFLLLKSDIRFIPRRYKFYNSKAILGKKILYGDLGVNQFGIAEIAYNYDLTLNDLDLNQFDYDKEFDNFIFHMFLSDIDKSGEYFNKYFNDFIWLRSLQSVINLNFKVNNLKFKDKNLQNFKFHTEAMRSNLKIIELKFNTENSDLDIATTIALPAFNPILKLKIKSNNLDSNDFIGIIPEHKNLLSAIKTTIAQTNDPLFNDVVISGVNLYGLPNLDSEIKVEVNNLKYNDKIIKNLVMKLSSAGHIIILRDLQAQLEEGDIDVKGTINTTLPMINVSALLSMRDINPNIILSSIGMPNKIDGIMNLTAKLQTNGYSIEGLLDNLKGNVGFVAAKINWQGFDIRKIIEGVDLRDHQKSYRMDLLDYYKNNGYSIFNEISGNFLLEDGVIQMRNMNFKNSRITGILNANFIIQTGLMNAEAKIAFIPIGQRRPLDFIIKTNGNVDNLNSQFDFNNLVKYIDRTSTEEDKAQYLRQQVRKKSSKVN